DVPDRCMNAPRQGTGTHCAMDLLPPGSRVPSRGLATAEVARRPRHRPRTDPMPASASAPNKPARKSAGRPVNSTITREGIVAVALEQIDRVGIHAFSLRDVARSLDVYPSTIYWHVASKDALLAEVSNLVMSGVV